MTARCHEDSCSIVWSEVTTGEGLKYQADVNFDADGGLVCVEGQGVGVLISPAAGNIVSVSAAGLFANLPEAVVTTLSGNPDNNGVGPGADSGSPQDSDTYSWTNSTGRDALVLVTGEFNFDYGILGPDHAYSYAAGNGQKAGRIADAAYEAGEDPTNSLSPFNAMVAMRLLADVGAAPTTSRKACRVGIGGMIHVSDPEGAEQKNERIPFLWMHRVANGGVLNMKSQAWYEGPSQTVNVVATSAAGTGLAGTGHELWNLQVAAVPL